MGLEQKPLQFQREWKNPCSCFMEGDGKSVPPASKGERFKTRLQCKNKCLIQLTAHSPLRISPLPLKLPLQTHEELTPTQGQVSSIENNDEDFV